MVEGAPGWGAQCGSGEEDLWSPDNLKFFDIRLTRFLRFLMGRHWWWSRFAQ